MEKLTLEKAFQYPFNRAVGLLNILWMFVPVFGWLALNGYGVRITKSFVRGEFEELPKFSFVSDMKLGFWMFLKVIPIMLSYVFFIFISIAGGPFLIGAVAMIFGICVLPIMLIHLYVHQTVESSFDISIVKPVFYNLGEYLEAFLKTLALALVFMVFSIVLIGIPANAFTKHIFLADFYRRYIAS